MLKEAHMVSLLMAWVSLEVLCVFGCAFVGEIKVVFIVSSKTVKTAWTFFLIVQKICFMTGIFGRYSVNWCANRNEIKIYSCHRSCRCRRLTKTVGISDRLSVPCSSPNRPRSYYSLAIFHLYCMAHKC